MWKDAAIGSHISNVCAAFDLRCLLPSFCSWLWGHFPIESLASCLSSQGHMPVQVQIQGNLSHFSVHASKSSLIRLWVFFFFYPQRCELCPHKDGALKRTDNGGTHTTHTCFGLLVECVSLANWSGVSTLKELCWCLLCVLLPSATHASLCFMTVCMFMRGRTRMHIVHGLWGVSLLGSLEGQAGVDCKYSVCVCLCVPVWARARRGTAVGLCPGLQGGIGTTLTHTPFYYFLFILPFPWPRSSHLFPPLSLPKSPFPQPSVSPLSSVPLHLLICVVLSLLFQVGQ